MPNPPPVPPPTSPDAPAAVDDGSTDSTAELADRARYLEEVMGEIDAEVRRRRASGDLPAGLERELDELFLEFSPVGLQGRARLRETLSLVDGSAYVDIAVPTASNKAIGSYVKRTIRKALGWYMTFVVAQIVKFAWSVSRTLHVVVDHIEDLESAVEADRSPDLPTTVRPGASDGGSWWAGRAAAALDGATARVLVADCGDATLIDVLSGAGLDAYGVDPSDLALEAALDRGLDVRAETVIDHLEVVADEALGGIVLTGSVQWLRPNEREHLLDLAATRLTVDGVLVLHSTSPEAWAVSAPAVVRDLAPGRPLHPETWAHLCAAHGLTVTDSQTGGSDRRLDHVGASTADAGTVNAAIDVLNELLLGPTEYLVVATRAR